MSLNTEIQNTHSLITDGMTVTAINFVKNTGLPLLNEHGITPVENQLLSVTTINRIVGDESIGRKFIDILLFSGVFKSYDPNRIVCVMNSQDLLLPVEEPVTSESGDANEPSSDAPGEVTPKGEDELPPTEPGKATSEEVEAETQDPEVQEKTSEKPTTPKSTTPKSSKSSKKPKSEPEE